MQPQFDGESMVGIQVSDIKPGSLFEQSGVAENDVIVRVNDIAIDSPDQTRRVFDEFATSEAIEIVVRRGEQLLTLNHSGTGD
jgi:type II secretory pathway component PulC